LAHRTSPGIDAEIMDHVLGPMPTSTLSPAPVRNRQPVLKNSPIGLELLHKSLHINPKNAKYRFVSNEI